jgi:hypothetical protein
LHFCTPGSTFYESSGDAVFSLAFIVIIAGLAFGGAMAVIGFGGFLTAWFHRRLGSPLPLPTLHNAFEKRLYLGVGLAGFVVWAITFLASLRIRL